MIRIKYALRSVAESITHFFIHSGFARMHFLSKFTRCCCPVMSEPSLTSSDSWLKPRVTQQHRVGHAASSVCALRPEISGAGSFRTEGRERAALTPDTRLRLWWPPIDEEAFCPCRSEDPPPPATRCDAKGLNALAGLMRVNNSV